ncbi:MAG: transcription elongation factor GreA [Bacteroidetes Order II. Incertae sedis bacterium]|nr:transcription elongation factor GreA [Bacteroidetes Order II. bacterium]
MSETLYLSQDGLNKLNEELQFLKTKERARIAQAIADARAQGDLSENAEYDAAKDAQGLLEARIAQLNEMIQNARVVDDSKMDLSKAYILSKVRVKNHKMNQEVTYILTSDREANFAQNKISVNSPIGKALLGRSVGDIVDVKVPAGIIKFEILEISR